MASLSRRVVIPSLRCGRFGRATTGRAFGRAFAGRPFRAVARVAFAGRPFRAVVRNAFAGRPFRALARIAFAACVAVLAAGCASNPPERQADLCAVFEQHPDWYDYARDSAEKWGTPVHVLMAFVRHESSYRSDARPPFRWFLFIPLGRASSAKGYAQALDPVWGEYQAERGRLFRSRSDMEDALDFVGWYNHKTWKELGIARTDAYRLYLAYHEGRGGYRRGTWKGKPEVQRYARRVGETARSYQSQLAGCEKRFRCDSWYQVWPFCG